MLRILTWNILCDKLAYNSFDRVPDQYIDWEYREPLIISFVLSSQADVICLQEVDKFDELMKHLHQLYEGHIVMKEDGVMGCALIWKRGTILSVKV